MPAEASKDKTLNMRHSKLKASEAALLAGELNKPSWESRNEGIHERVSFEDCIWGFDLAGGSFYKTPLRVTAVKPDSRAEKAGIRPGDRLLRINDIDTSTLTIHEAHDIIKESGIHLKIAVTAPEDLEDSYHCWQDPTEEGYDSEEERRKEEERARKRQVHAKVSSYWSLQWPWVSKRRVIYRESNCYMVPSKYESKNRDKFPLQPTFGPKVLDDIVLHSAKSADQTDVDTKVAEDKLNTTENNVEVKKDNPNDVATKTSEEVNADLLNPVGNVSNGLDRLSEVDEEESPQSSKIEEPESDITESESQEISAENEDEIIDEVLNNNEGLVKEDDENVINDILNGSDMVNSITTDENQR